MYPGILSVIKDGIRKIEKRTAAMLKGEKELHDLPRNIHGRLLNLGNQLLPEPRIALEGAASIKEKLEHLHIVVIVNAKKIW